MQHDHPFQRPQPLLGWGQALCLAFIAVLGLPQLAHAHTFITMSGELQADGNDLTITIRVNRADLITTFAVTGPLTHDQLRLLSRRIGAYLVHGLPVRIDGAEVAGNYAGYLPDLLDPGAKINGGEELPEAMFFVLTWKIPHGASQLDISSHLFVEENMPIVCQMSLELTNGTPNQISYIDASKHAVFQLRPSGKAHPALAPAPPSAAVPSLAGPSVMVQPSAAGAVTVPHGWRLFCAALRQALCGGADHGLSLVCLIALVALRKMAARAAAFLGIFACSVAIGIVIAPVAHAHLWHTLAAGCVCLLAVSQMSASLPAAAYWWPLLLCAVGQGIAVAVGFQQVGITTTSGIVWLVLGAVAPALAVLALAGVLLAPWRSRSWYAAAVGRPLLGVIVVAAGVVGVLRAVTSFAY